MRLTALLDNITAQGGSGPWVPHQPLATPLGENDSAEFDRLLAGLLPCRTNDPELCFAERTGEGEEAKARCRTGRRPAGAGARRLAGGVGGGEVSGEGAVVARKRGRGRPSKAEVLAREAERQAQEAARTEASVGASTAA